MKTTHYPVMIFASSIVLGVLGILTIDHFKYVFDRNNQIKNYYHITIKDSNIYKKDNSFTPGNFLLELYIQNVQFPDIVFKQACLETGFFNSFVWKKYNNPFGFFYNGEFIKFNSWQESINYYKNWQVKNYSCGDYYRFLINIKYAEDTCYIVKLKNINLGNLK